MCKRLFVMVSKPEVKKMETRVCVLNEAKICDNCGECDRCDLDPAKICDNCCKCITNEEGGYHKVPLSDLKEVESGIDTQQLEGGWAFDDWEYDGEGEGECDERSFEMDIPLPDKALIDEWERRLAQAAQKDAEPPNLFD